MKTDALSLEMLYAEPSIIGTTPEGMAWSADGRRLAFLWNDAGRSFRDIWVYDVAAGAKRRLTWLGDVPGRAGPGVTQAAWLGDGRVVQTQQLPRRTEQAPALLGEAERPGGAREERPAQLPLEPLDLQADRRLRSAKAVAGPGKAFHLGNGHKAAEQIKIEV